jgi:hypothetical protein
MIILKWVSEIECGDVKWINLAQERGKYRNLEKTVMSFWVHKMLGKKFLSS